MSGLVERLQARLGDVLCHNAADEIKQQDTSIGMLEAESRSSLERVAELEGVVADLQKIAPGYGKALARITELEAENNIAIKRRVKMRDQIDKLEAELKAARNQLSTERPTSFGNYKWACGHEGPSVCKQCWDEKLERIAALTEIQGAAKDLYDNTQKELETQEGWTQFEFIEVDVYWYDKLRGTLAAIPEPWVSVAVREDGDVVVCSVGDTDREYGNTKERVDLGDDPIEA